MHKEVPIKMARAVSEAYNQDQVIIICLDKTHGKQCVTTFGRTVQDCEEAAEAGNLLKKALGWPDEHCHAMVPPRRKRGKPKQ